jgi:NAD(P)-dependent dehydrogenase (short-subunit alcohol dehydrogenase family)
MAVKVGTGPSRAVSFDYSGAVVLVTGAGSGIGKAIAKSFASAGGTVVAADISSDAAEDTVTEIRDAGGKAVPFIVDVADELDVSKMVTAIVDQLGQLDIAINNAGIEADHLPLALLDSDNWRRVSDVNLSSVFYAMKAQIPVMLDQTAGGCIVNTASISGLIGGYNLAAYTATKHGVVGMTKAAAMDYADSGRLRINALCPGLVDTPFIGDLPEPIRARLINGIPMRRPAQADEMAQAVLWLCSDGASYVTGHTLVIDGGASLGGEATRFDL